MLLVLALVGCVTLLVSAVLALGVGSVPVSPHAVVDVVLQRMGADVPAEVLADRIVWDLRMPRPRGRRRGDRARWLRSGAAVAHPQRSR